MSKDISNRQPLITTLEEANEGEARAQSVMSAEQQHSRHADAQRHRTRYVFIRIVTYALLVALLLYAFFPIFWLLSTSFKSQGEAFFYPPTFWPHQFTLHSYQILPADQQGFVRYFANSLIVSVCTCLLTLLAAVPGGYVLSRFHFRGVRAVLLVILATQMFPYAVILISLYTLFRQLHMLNTYPALVLAFTTFSLPFSIWMVKGFCDTLPTDLEEAGRIDGLSRVGVLVRIVFPLIIPGVVAVGFFAFLNSWNELLYAVTLTTSPDMRTIPAGFIGTYVGEFQDRWPDMMAASVVVSLPIVILFTLFQKQLVSGLTAGAVKG
ncbi:ABC transporter permease [Ktedonobacter sp. SOSP1-52]|uniref:carbohydrate ABC transporter permease n=1 Tax=Ktedonobacter sp. SOSP1-52 TaxID=2778366 RepID=UPI0019163F81|nr:carbohydrate ABC transporter permease [Ktedonobacter sp. SOSP1-52]GHO68150.1 ABC transporter permease [Ktedonobacter sp. SOSP1-52]